MLLINLIAARRAERRKRELIRGALTRSMVVAGGITAFSALSMTISMEGVSARTHDVDMQTAGLQSTVSKVEKLQADMAAVQPKVTTLLTAQNSTNRLRAVLEEVGASLPQKTWLTSFASSASPPDSFTMTGQSISNGMVGQAMLSLDKQTYIKNVDLHFTQGSQQSKAINFELVGTMQPLGGASNGN